MYKMAGSRSHLRRKKRKHNRRKAAASSKRKRPDTELPQQSTSEVANSSCAAGEQELSDISCECRHLADRRRCSASPEQEGPEGKENELRAERDSSRLNRVLDKQESDEETDKPIFPDDDSNQILPVEQFFGNMETVQDVPRRNPATSADARKENRRRHFYACEDADD
ncbi:UPF0688 protein C1orf174 homolog [Synchiropus splendidus]|uniref:UPF0688 protein C1orf174 homolog n=1 Tax=Synchiropus splendidus TaxID=270530 RepID=UPI00237EA797|nr:UPF0688 protein C1orf174 homolog [Synchiropus splendidus]